MKQNIKQKYFCSAEDIKARGSATLEMSILMPMLCILLILLIYMGFYLYDRTVLYCDAYLSALYAVCEPDSKNEDAYITADENMQESVKEQLIAMPSVRVGVTVDYGQVRVDYEGAVEVPIADQNIFFQEWNAFQISESCTAKRHKPVTFIRQCRKAEQLLQGKE